MRKPLEFDPIPEALEALSYVADMTYCGTDAEWHFKPGYDPQAVLDAITKLRDCAVSATKRDGD